MHPDPLDHLHSPPIFASWPFAVEHQGLVVLALFAVTFAVLAFLFIFSYLTMYRLDQLLVGDVWHPFDQGRRRVKPNDRPVDPARIEARARFTRGVAAGIVAARMPPAPEPPPPNKPWLWLVPFSDLWFERCMSADGERKRPVVTLQACAVFNAWVEAADVRCSETHHLDRDALYKAYGSFAFGVLENGDAAMVFLPPRQFWPLVRERFGVRDTTYGREARWRNYERTVPLHCSTVPPKYDSTPSVLRAVATEAMAEAQASSIGAPVAPVARARKRL